MILLSLTFHLLYRNNSWNFIKEVLPNKPEVKKNLQLIYQYAKQFSMNESKELVDSSAAYLFQLFIKEDMVLQAHLQILKQLFGSISSSDVYKVFEVRRSLLFICEYNHIFHAIICE